MPPARPSGRAAVLLAGGRGSRLGGVDKALLTRDGVPLLQHWCAALLARSVPTVVVGPPHLAAHLPSPGSEYAGESPGGPQAAEGAEEHTLLRLTREDPPLAGPAAAVAAGVRRLAADDQLPVAGHVLLLAVDTIDPPALLDALQELAPAPGATVIPVDAEGRAQMLASLVDAAALRRRVAALDPGEEVGRPLRWLLEGFTVEHPSLPEGLGRDVDTAEDAAELGVVPPGPAPASRRADRPGPL